MAKTRFFRVAVEGATTDGRAIERQWLLDAAQTYNPQTYAARVNCEHVRSLAPEGAFGAYGDVLELKTEEIEIDVGGKKEKKLALFAALDALDPLVSLNKKGQKLYTSIEISPNFANSGKAYLVGLAVTDSPASLGTEMLQFAASQGENNPLAHRKQDKANLFTAAAEADIVIEDADAPNPDPTGIFASIKGLLDRFTGSAPAAGQEESQTSADPAAGDPPAPAQAEASAFAAFGVALGQIAALVEKTSSETTAAFARLGDRLNKVEEGLAQTPKVGFTQRPAATGGAPAVRTDC